MVDAVKAIGQDMQEKAPDKLIRGQGHGLVTTALSCPICRIFAL